jgi:hypothetical protein
MTRELRRDAQIPKFYPAKDKKMKDSMKNLLVYLGVILLPVSILIGTAVSGQMGVSEYLPPVSNTTPLKEKVRKATTRFREIDVALAEGYKQGPPCVSVPEDNPQGRFADWNPRLTCSAQFGD